LDYDVAARLERVQRKRRIAFKTLINEILRAGLDAAEARQPPRKPFVTTGFHGGPSLIGSLDNIEEVLSLIEGEDHT
jgi:hypothetical protein